MEQIIIDWALANLPPESGPLFAWMAGHYDVARPGLLLFFTMIVFCEVMLISLAASHLRRSHEHE